MNYKITVNLVLIITLLICGISMASETRQSAMGNSGIFLDDDANVFLFPGTLIEYQDLVVAEMRSKFDKSIYSVGVHMGYDNMASGLYINQPINSPLLGVGYDVFSVINPITGLPIFDFNTTLNNSYGIFFATRAAGFNLGFGVLSAGASVENQFVEDSEENIRYLAIVAGVSNKMMDLGLTVELPSIENKDSDPDPTQEGLVTDEYSGFGIDARGRFNLLKRAGTHIFPVARILFGSSSLDVKTVGEGEVDFSILGFAAGVGFSRPINEDNLLVIGIEAFGYTSLTADTKDGDEETESIMTIPAIHVGVESRISSWLIGRIGVAHTNQQTVEETKPNVGDKTEETSSESQFHIQLGLGMEFGNFLIDFAFNENLLFDGPAVISNSATEPMAR